MVPGTSKKSDLAICISVAKSRLRIFLLKTQKQGNLIMLLLFTSFINLKLNLIE